MGENGSKMDRKLLFYVKIRGHQTFYNQSNLTKNYLFFSFQGANYHVS
jgi:hypothetical protein